ncbi:MAG: hypothetical protein ACHQSE_05555 [Gemmatimonadales bacterium]
MSSRSAHLTAAAVAMFATAAAARAQGGAAEVHATSAASVHADAGTVVTSVFAVRNLRGDTLRALPMLTVPRGWSVVMGSAPVVLAPGAADTWLVGVAVPASAPAGGYVIAAALAARDTARADSIVVYVNERRALEVLPVDLPGWVMAGSRYESRFVVRNRGNVESTIALTGATSRGTRVQTLPAALTLAPGASAPVTVRVAIANIFTTTTDDVAELSATDQTDRSVRASASTRTTVVSSDEGGRFTTIPATLSLRSIGSASGVSPIALSGAGLLADGKTSADFLLQAPTGHQSPFGFGERDEYRANVQSDRFSLKLGDNLYGFSELTSSGTLGTGAQFQGTNGTLSGGLYVQHPRWIPGSHAEEAAFVGTAPDSIRQLSTTFVERQSADGAVSVGSIGGHLRLMPGMTLHLETASSDSGHASGLAARARLTGTIDKVSYDLGTLDGDRNFAGLARGTTVQDGAISTHLTRMITVGASGSLRVSNFATPLAGVPAQRLSTAALTASYGGLATLDYGWLSRHDDGSITPLDGTQHGLRATTTLPVGAATHFSVSFEHGTVNAADASAGRAYNVVSVSLQTRLGTFGTISAYGARDDGNTLTGASSGVANTGVTLDLHLPFSFELALQTSAQRATLGVFDGSGMWFSQSDARLDYHFAGGQTISLRQATWQNPLMQGSENARATYLEFRTPLRLPVGPSHSAGRAEGIIVDANTGKPVVGALVRIADQAAVTDKNGRVEFKGLVPARDRVSIDATGAAAGALLVGDPFVEISATAKTPAKFSLAIARGGSVRALVSRLDAAGGSIASHADSLVTVGMEPNVLVALVGARDTIYQASDDRGRVDFGAVAPGKWALVVMPGDLPDHHVFEAGRIELDVQAGERNDIALRLVPQRRTVTFIGHETALQAKPLPDKKN